MQLIPLWIVIIMIYSPAMAEGLHEITCEKQGIKVKAENAMSLHVDYYGLDGAPKLFECPSNVQAVQALSVAATNGGEREHTTNIWLRPQEEKQPFIANTIVKWTKGLEPNVECDFTGMSESNGAATAFRNVKCQIFAPGASYDSDNYEEAVLKCNADGRASCAKTTLNRCAPLPTVSPTASPTVKPVDDEPNIADSEDDTPDEEPVIGFRGSWDADFLPAKIQCGCVGGMCFAMLCYILFPKCRKLAPGCDQ